MSNNNVTTDRVQHRDNEDTKRRSFEVVESSDNLVVFKRIIPQKGRSNKDFKKITASLPTATIHCFEYDDFIKLKEIEQQLVAQQEEKPKTDGFFKLIGKFLEV